MPNNFAGYLLKIGNTVFPNKYIKFSTWQSTPKQITSIDTYTDADGLLHETPAPHQSTKLEFETPPMTLDDKIAMQSYFPANTGSNENRRHVNITYWNDYTNDYDTAECYVPDITFSIMTLRAGGSNTLQPFYNPIRIAFIEY